MGDCLKRTNGAARHCISFVKVLNDGLQQVHRVCPEEQATIGKEAIHMADTLLREVVAGVERVLKNLVVKTRELRQQSLPIQVVARAEGENKEAYPGYESLYETRRGQTNEYLRIWRKMIQEVCESIRDVDTLTVYNIEFVPREVPTHPFTSPSPSMCVACMSLTSFCACSTCTRVCVTTSVRRCEWLR
jgi:hypothetical protein